MGKKLTVLILLGVMIISICGCESKETTKIDNAESEMIQAEEADVVQEDKEETAQSKSAVYTIQAQPIQDAYEMQDWQVAYAEYIEEFELEYGEWLDNITYSLIYVDEDDIPELVINPGISIGYNILTFYDGEIDVLQTDRCTVSYIERENLLDNYSGTMGFYHDYIYTIENGKWVYVTGGEYNEGPTYEDFTFRWENEEVEGDVYEEKLRAVFDIEHAIDPEQFDTLEEMLFRLQASTVISQQHHYELCVGDVTWDGAEMLCTAKGGYLATITSVEEYERIKEGIENSNLTHQYHSTTF